MSKKNIDKIGKWLCILGVITLVISIVIVFFEGGFLTPKLLLASMILNTMGIVLLRYEKEPKE